MKRRALAGRRGGNEQGAASEADRLARLGDGAARIAPRHGADSDQSSIVSAERRHRTVVRPRAAEEEILVVPAELRRCERAEDELLLDAEEVERPAPLPGVECAER